MPTIRKRGQTWQAQVRRAGYPALSKSFTTRADAIAWAREKERSIDRAELPIDIKELKRLTVADLLKRYEQEITPRKRGAVFERSRNGDFVDHLRRFRNAVFHFQKVPLDERLVKFLDMQGSETWIRELFGAFDRFLMRELPVLEDAVQGPPAHAASCLRVRTGQQGPRYASLASLSRPPEHPAHGVLYGAIADAVQGFLEELSDPSRHSVEPSPNDYDAGHKAHRDPATTPTSIVCPNSFT
jgi:hypothetical protein